MTKAEQVAAAKKFAEYWKDQGYEKGQSQKFWIDLLEHVYGVSDIASFISFEDQVHLDHTSFIDGYIPSTHVMIEQKSLGKDLRKAIKQSDGQMLSPFQQAKRYAAELPYSQRPRWIITCNFAEFNIYDMEKPNGEPEIIYLKDLPQEYYRMQFLVDTGSDLLKKEMEISLKAGDIVGVLYDALLKQYKNPESPETLKSLNKLCVRLVFCLYAEDAGIFGKHLMFHDYLRRFEARDARKALIELFQVLDTKPEDRDPYLDDDLAAFPYVNGGLFADEQIEIPRLTDEIIDLILHKASEDFDWSGISPTIFGAVFESTLNPETRRSGGMHYTSIENIHKVIDPLFLDDLTAELEQILEKKQRNERRNSLEAYRDKLASLCFLDPACGSGNFLTESYTSLRKLENRALRQIIDDTDRQTEGQMLLTTQGELNPIKVSIGQFYGIEINDFAVSVAMTALWIAEAQMMEETRQIVHDVPDFLPLKTFTNILEGNALRVDWTSIVPREKLSYIMGNPPFIGSSVMTQGSEQKQDIHHVFSEMDKNDVQDLDYVTCWYKLATEYIRDSGIEVCFVSTNSICQGAQVPILWQELLKSKIHINFAYRTFRWDSESNKKAAVHCVIIGFSLNSRSIKRIYENDIYKNVKNISPYLVEGDSVIVSARKKPLCNVPEICFGNQPRDGGFFVLTNEEKDAILAKEPQLAKWIRFYMGATEFINNKSRWCLWLKGASPRDIKSSKTLCDRVESVRQFRLSSKAKTTNGYAKVPHLFAQITQNDCDSYIIIPNHSSERRKYVPIGFANGDVISSNAVQIIPDATIYHFGVLTSNVHMSWMRTVCGRLKSDYRYSKEVVYNNFPWCNPTPEQKAKIERTAQAILDARALYPDCSLADLYDETVMPPELRKAHQANDRAVMEAYGFWGKLNSESECVAALMKMYQELTAEK